MSLRDKVEGNELDLSLNELTEVPVKELAAAAKATHLDLSCNCIYTLPADFASLTHLVKIDLSRNKLTELPQNFGSLFNLQYLDLDRNKLKTLPISFCRLKNLRWLDLKDNPLEPKLKAIAGDCLDEKQCQGCAKKIVAHMQSIDSNLEREKQKKLKEKKEKEALEKARVEKEVEEQRKQKKMIKEKRKAESKARNEEKLKHNKENIEKNDPPHIEADTQREVIVKGKKGLHWCIWFLPLVCIFSALAIYFFCPAKNFPLNNISMSDVKSFVQKYSFKFSKMCVKFWKVTVIPLAVTFKQYFLENIHSIMLYISDVASRVELYLSVYF